MNAAKHDDGAQLRQAMSGMSDGQLARIGFVHVLWNGLERLLVSQIWAVARWDQDVGELVTADLGNAGRTSLLRNLSRQFIEEQRLLENIEDIASLFDELRDERNNLAHGMYAWGFENIQQPGSLMKFSARRPTEGGLVRVQTVDARVDALDGLIGAMQFFAEQAQIILGSIRRHYQAKLEGLDVAHPDFAARVHGWRAPSFDRPGLLALLQRLRRLRSQRERPSQHQASQE